MTRAAPLVAAVLSSLLGWASAEASVLCPWTHAAPGGEVHRAFLRPGPAPARLYHGVWSAQRALLRCAWSDDAALLRRYRALCRRRAHGFSRHPGGGFASLLEGQDACVPGERSEVSAHPRVKRGFIVPGTLWCGSGNKAPSYEDLGVFTDTDRCCREHDQCKHTILSFHSEFGVFNSNIFTMSHCDCDSKFRSCLMEANDSISHVVGYTFFNLLKMHCFEFSHRLQCTQRNWFGMCKETKMALYAEVHPPTLFESTSPTEFSMNVTSPTTNTTTPAELQSSSTSDPQPFSATAAASTVPAPSTSPVTPLTSVSTSSAADASGRPAGSAPGSTDSLENKLPTITQPPAELGPDITERRRSCSVYKDLDDCESRIPPQEGRYGLHNPEAKTLYHCNCTARLFQTLATQRRLTKVQALLLGHVSPSCFLPQDCAAGSTCTAALVKAELPRVERRRSGAAVEEQHHLQALQLKVRRPNSQRAKRKEGAASLHKLCLRVTQRRKSRKRGGNAHRQAAPDLV